MQVFIAGEYIDGTTNPVATNTTIATMSASQAAGGTIRIANSATTEANIDLWAGGSAIDEWRVTPTMVMRPYSVLTIPGVSVGPSQSVIFKSSIIGLWCSVDMGFEDDYTNHASAAIEVDGTTYAVATNHTLFTAAAGDSYRGNIRVVNFGTVNAVIRIYRKGFAIEDAVILRPNQIIDVEDIIIGDSSISSLLLVNSTVVNVAFSFRGWQVEG